MSCQGIRLRLICGNLLKDHVFDVKGSDWHDNITVKRLTNVRRLSSPVIVMILYAFSCVQFVCQSNSIRRPIRYTGNANKTYELSFRPCTRVLARFYSDGSVVGRGFYLNYTVDPIRKHRTTTGVVYHNNYCSN